MLCSGVDHSRFLTKCAMAERQKRQALYFYTLKQSKCQKSVVRMRIAKVWFWFYSFTVNVSPTCHAQETGDADPDLMQSEALDLILRNM